MINGLPSGFETVAGTAVHYLRFDGETPEATPIVLTHGWPSTFLEHVELARRLARPSEHGAAGEESFTVIVPSPPGFRSPRSGRRCPPCRHTSCGIG
ncbi:epoxide hydrolase N-terminal domain-containing protein [Qaidamihabitans albus]|uniref:epoxide hydrolase N-terminal domain-containing protein n=1 Tax=Qaidamihabitans albus TaxID=2795733 RepID=UPI001F237CE8|nr:epoxide hydrolase N-terminal domain-containing protein [Qaidamihabitans albus]